MTTKVKIIGPPGTGKTETLKAIVAEKVERGVMLDEIVFTSFTNDAANEAAQRVCEALDIIERPEWFRTEHSCCFRMLGMEHDRVFARKWLRQFVNLHPAYWYSWQDDGHTDWEFRDAEGRMSTESMLRTPGDFAEFFYGLSRNMLVGPLTIYDRYQSKTELPDGFSRKFFLTYCSNRDAFKKEQRLYDFPDMIGMALDRKLVPFGMRILICDEAQDMSPLQWELIKMWSESAEETYIAGDFLQSVYGFQGADPHLFMSFDGEEHVLKQSYRLTPEVKSYSKAIAAMTGLPYPEFEPDAREGAVYRQTITNLDWSRVNNAFFLCRTRYLIRLMREYLMTKYVPFSCERGEENPLYTKKGYAYRAIIKLQQDRLITDREIKVIAEYTSKPFVAYGTKTHIKRLMEGDYSKRQLRQLGFTEEFFQHLNEPNVILLRHFELDERTYLHKMFNLYGIDVEPRVTLTTMHGSKGRERDLVLLDPNLTHTTWNSYTKDPVSETLLQYVAATRAKTNLALLYPTERHSFPLPSLRVMNPLEAPPDRKKDINRWLREDGK